MANTGVTGRIVRAEAPTQGIRGVTVAAFDIDPLNGEDHLGTVQSLADGTFTITYSPDRYRSWFLDRNPDIEVRIYGEGARLLLETAKTDEVQTDVFDLGTIEIHGSNFRVPDNGQNDPASIQARRDDPYWLVTHTSLHPGSAEPIRLTSGNEIEWLVDGAAMFPALTREIAGATQSIRFMNMAFAVDDLFSKFEFPFPKDHKTVEEGDTVTVHRLEKIMVQKADDANLPVHVLSWDLMDAKDALSVRLFDDVDLADEVREYFKETNVETGTLETSQLLHIKMAVIDGRTGFVIGSTMKQGYFNDQEHLIRDARHGGRQLMHDASLRVRGPAVRFIDQTFTTLWNVGAIGVPLAPAAQSDPIGGGAAVQVLRTLPGEMFRSQSPDDNIEDLPHGETGILEAHQRAIMKAEEYIYIEDQYFTSPEIANAIMLRMAEKPDLEVILVLNVKPDIPGYSKKQAALIAEMRKSLGKRRNRLGVFTVWSSDTAQSTYEIAHVYVHAKLCIIDDRWATVGTANIDGASLNQRQWGLILQGVLEELSLPKKILVALLAPLLPALAAIASVPLMILHSAASGLPSLLDFIRDSILKEVARPTAHAVPHRATQPPRHPELNLVVYSGIGGQPETGKIKELRESLWTEQLGDAPPPAKPPKGWVFHWRQAACRHLQKVRAASTGIPSEGETTTKILKWIPQDNPEKYLEALQVDTNFIEVRGSGEEMLFNIHEAQQ